MRGTVVRFHEMSAWVDQAVSQLGVRYNTALCNACVLEPQKQGAYASMSPKPFQLSCLTNRHRASRYYSRAGRVGDQNVPR